MSSPAPSTLGGKRTIGLGAPAGQLFREHLEAAAASKRIPVIVHPAVEDQRELAAHTRAFIGELGWNGPWGLGGICTSMQDAAGFAASGYTWFHLALSASLDSRAATMTLDELDAAIVSLEDAGCYADNWHGSYLDQGVQLADLSRFKFSDEALARAAVKFGPALKHAGEVTDALRTLWSGRDTQPDIEASIAASGAPTTPAELIFLARELLQRGIGNAGHLRIAPAFGALCEPGCELEEPPTLSPNNCPPGATLSIPAQFDGYDRWKDAHIDYRDAAVLAAMRVLATKAPALFREWLSAACEAFPAARGGRTYRLTDDDLRFLPQATDDQLAESFFDQWQGRQLFLVTWDDVYRQLGGRLTEFLA